MFLLLGMATLPCSGSQDGMGRGGPGIERGACMSIPQQEALAELAVPGLFPNTTNQLLQPAPSHTQVSSLSPPPVGGRIALTKGF